MDLQVLNVLCNTSSKTKMVLATITRTWGSTPRKPGAQMLIFPDGRTEGTIGGGCGEAEVKRRAMYLFAAPEPVLLTLDLTAELAEEEGMVCGGRMEVFIEPV
ncbi:MAG: XdhC family protein [Bacillota bacterium]